MEDKITLTADVVIELADSSIVLVKRKNEPYKGHWALPGGKMDGNETIQQAAMREAKEETGLDIRLDCIIGVYSASDRDPRGRYISVAFLAYPHSGTLEAASDAAEVMITRNYADLALAFDHHQILADYIAMREERKHPDLS